MKRNFFVLMMMVGAILLFSCKPTPKTEDNVQGNVGFDKTHILQQKDGTISLNVDKAECYQDKINPANSTAEWSVIVSKSGRYDVWLSSSTKDTTDLQYKNSVKLSILDNRLEALPACNKIIYNSTDVTRPYFRADSFMGSLYIQDTGVYYIQVISEKIVQQSNEASATDVSKLLSVNLTPSTK